MDWFSQLHPNSTGESNALFLFLYQPTHRFCGGGQIIKVFIIASCVLVFSARYKIINTYLSYKYPNPVEFYGLIIPIEKGFIYSKDENGIRIVNPLDDKYTIFLMRNFTLSHGDSFEEYIKKMNHMVIKINEFEHNNIKYLEVFSVDREWLFNLSLFFPDQKIMVMFRGTKEYYKNFDIFLENILNGMGKQGISPVSKQGESIAREEGSG